MPNFFEEKELISPAKLLNEAALAGDIEKVKNLLSMRPTHNGFSLLKSNSDDKLSDEKAMSFKEEIIFNEHNYNKLLEEIIIKMRTNSIKKQIYLNIINLIIAYAEYKKLKPLTYFDVFENAVLNLEHTDKLYLKIDMELIFVLSQAGFYEFDLVKSDDYKQEFTTYYEIMRKTLDENSFQEIWERITQALISYYIKKNEKIHLSNITILLENRCNSKLIYDALIKKLRVKETDPVCKEFKAYGHNSFSEQQRKKILKAVSKNTALETLSIGREFIGENIKPFIRYLASNTTLTYLELHRFSDADLKQITDGVHTSSLQSLKIENSVNDPKKYKIKNKPTPLSNILNSFKYLKSLAIKNSWTESKVNAEMPLLLESHNHLTKFDYHNYFEIGEIKYRVWTTSPPDFKGIDPNLCVLPIFPERNRLEVHCSSVIKNMIIFNRQLRELEIRKWLVASLSKDIFQYHMKPFLKATSLPDNKEIYINPMIRVLYDLIPAYLHKFFEITLKRNSNTQYIEIRSPNFLLQILKNGIDSLNKDNKKTFITINKQNQNSAILRSFKECYGNIEATQDFKLNFSKKFFALVSDIKIIKIPARTFTPHFFHKQVLPYIVDDKKNELVTPQSRR